MKVLHSLLTTCGWPKLIVYIAPTTVWLATVLCRSVGIGNMHQAMSLYKLKAFVTCTKTELSTWEPLPIYPFLLWTTHLQSTVQCSPPQYACLQLCVCASSQCIIILYWVTRKLSPFYNLIPDYIIKPSHARPEAIILWKHAHCGRLHSTVQSTTVCMFFLCASSQCILYWVKCWQEKLPRPLLYLFCGETLPSLRPLPAKDFTSHHLAWFPS